MQVINTRNVHAALPEALYQLRRFGIERPSRNGPVLMAPCPVTTCYHQPLERVLFWALRDANPFFHLFESLWMLSGRNDVNYLKQFVSTIGQFSDDGKKFHGAYGFRWREHFAFDQLRKIADSLRADYQDRRQVLQMWDANYDLDVDQNKCKDLPCNVVVHFQVVPYLLNDTTGEVLSKLDMTVFNRSNDIVWGCYGANAVHFSILQEYMAAMVGVPVGRYWQVSNNWHGYLKTVEPLEPLIAEINDPLTTQVTANPYADGYVKPYPLVDDHGVQAFDSDLQMFLDEGYNCIGYKTAFFRKVALPMLRAWTLFKEQHDQRHERAIVALGECQATDWRKACIEWVARRGEKARLAEEAT